MRRGRTDRTPVRIDPHTGEMSSASGVMIALSLGRGACAEHERGLPEIRAAAGMSDAPGAERHRVREPDGLFVRASDTRGGKIPLHIFDLDAAGAPDTLPHASPDEVPDPVRDPCGYTSRWGRSALRVVASDPDVVAFLRDFRAALPRGDAGILPLSISGEDAGPSLGLVIMSRIPPAIASGMETEDLARLALEAEIRDCGALGDLSRAGIGFHHADGLRIGPEEMSRHRTAFPFLIRVVSAHPDLDRGVFGVEALREIASRRGRAGSRGTETMVTPDWARGDITPTATDRNGPARR